MHHLVAKILFINCIILILCCSCSLSEEQVQQRDSYLYRAQVYYQNQKYMNALQQIEFALEIDPEYKRALISKGWTLYYLNRIEEAEEIFRNAEAMDDTDPWLQYGLGAVSYKKGIDILNRLAKVNQRINATKDPKLQEELQKKYRDVLDRYSQQKEKLFDESIEHFEKAIKTATDNIELYKMLATVYATKGPKSYPEALKHIDHYIQLLDTEYESLKTEKSAKEELRLDEDLFQKDKEEIDLMIESLTKQIEKNRKEYIDMQALAGEWSFTLTDLAIHKLTPKSSKAEHLKVRKQAQDCENRLLSIVKIAPDASIHYQNLAKLAEIQGKYFLAEKYLNYYLATYPLADPAERVNARLELEKIQEKMKSSHK